QSSNEQLSLGRSPNASQFVSRWSSNERRTFQYRVTASNDTVGGNYPFSLSISYRENGSRNQTNPHLVGIIPDPEQSFSVGNLHSTLRVGQQGFVSGTVTNEGPQRAPNAVLVLAPQRGNTTFSPTETEYALGTLDSGESKPFDFRIDVSDTADRGPRQLSFVVRYQNQDGDPRQSKSLDAQINVHPRKDEFRIDANRASVEAGSTGTISLVVTNNRNETLRNIDAQAFVDSPLTVNDNEAFIPKLEPNQSATIRFDIGADGGTLPNTYPASVDFQYDTPDGETKLTDTYSVPVRVTSPERGGVLSFVSGSNGILVLLGIAVLLVLVAVFVLRRR
ncbi:COG1361 S-layer family protein, partial [Haladaptatus sp.]|uniref:COG1361 S-layer family protein n=1 Tax=Haladaptatus sp. TaxID=1973141 RepID=UPI003C491331